MNHDLLPCVEVNPATPPKASVIWLHGLGADGHDFEGLIPELRLPAEAAVRFVFPHAPRRPVTLNGGYVMRAWYDVYSLDPGRGEDEAGIRASAAQVDALVAREVAGGVPTQRIVLAGFSQGGAIVLHTGLRHPQLLAGIMALSTYLPLPATLPAQRHPANQGVSIFMGHGVADSVVRYEFGARSCAGLQALGYNVEWHEYPMDHAVCLEEIAAIRAWLLRILA